jgi:hypothetical protein
MPQAAAARGNVDGRHLRRSERGRNSISDTQLERLVKLALGKRTSPEVKTDKAVMACITVAKTVGGHTVQAPGAASEFAHGHQPKWRLGPEDKAGNRLSGYAGAEELPSASDDARDAPPERWEAATQVSPAAPVAPPGSVAPRRSDKTQEKEGKDQGGRGTRQLKPRGPI